MTLSVFDLFKIGIGPSSSHTVGPMRAAFRFVELLAERGVLEKVGHVRVDLYGSLALTGRGHATDTAVLLGLSGERPDTVDPDGVAALVAGVREQHEIRLAGWLATPFDESADLLFHEDETLPQHPNGMRLTAFASSSETLASETFFSVGGGFVVREGEDAAPPGGRAARQGARRGTVDRATDGRE
jgi:L-serine dehydratase